MRISWKHTLGAGFLVCFMAASGHGQTPIPWKPHDMNRPRPPQVAPGVQSLPVPPPGDAVVLFDGRDLSKWQGPDGSPAPWKVENGYMEVVLETGSIRTREGFGDVQLHVEWASPASAAGEGQDRGNSGVYLMGLYEVQVLDSWNNETYADGQAGALYGQQPPLANASLPPGEWQAYDIVFRRPRFDHNGALIQPARLTVFHNGVLVQDAVEMVGPTSWLKPGLYRNHPDRLPLQLQNHGHPVRYRNIWLRPLPEWEPAGPSPETAPELLLPEDVLDRYVGRYLFANGGIATISREGRQLRVHFFGRRLLDLIPRSLSEFDFRWTAARLVFDLTGDGTPTGLRFHIGSERRPARRME